MESSADIVGHLAWPITVIFVLWWFEKPIKALLSRLKSVKHGEFEYSFAEEMKVAAALAGPDANEFVRTEPVLVERYRKFMKLSIEYEGVNANGSYRKLKNGLLICNVHALLESGKSEATIALPAAYTHQVTGVQFLGDEVVTVLQIHNNIIRIRFASLSHDRKIEAVVSGV
ncbi:hypothetical protein [Pseudomonas hunanensis]|uniref:hypothetical protein n=1 Tax=Pseudomonas hunanensis TaxID=1247546 RepID=UPI00240661DE|nr:hypothetical protein [Pseudomonas hunanensis]MDF9756773.1 glutaredoxin-related protein [Pseudomonas hunanensis]